MSEERLQELLQEVEELIGLVAQQTDSRSTNLQVNIEDAQKQLTEVIKKRLWAFMVAFVGVVFTVALTFSVLGFEVWERFYDRVSAVEAAVCLIKSTQDEIKQSTITKPELETELYKIHRERDKERAAALAKILEEVRKEIRHLRPRSEQ